MRTQSSIARFASLGATLCSLAGAGFSTSAHATAVSYVVTAQNVTSSGQNLTVYSVFVRFNGPTDTVLNAFNLTALNGSSLTGFWHKDLSSYNSGVLSQEFGTWNPAVTGSATANRPVDSYLTIGGQATGTNTSNADPGWPMPTSWTRPDLPSNGAFGWFNSSPPNLQGRAGISPNTATDVRLAQFVLSQGHATRSYSLTIGYNDGVSGSAVQFFTGTFCLSQTPAWYPDADGDGFGAASATGLVFCTPPDGYVANNLDCNDALQTYADADGDGFGAGPLAPCGVATNTDCNDANAALNPNTVWFADADGDGFGSSGDGTLVQCAQPAGYVLVGADNCPTIANPSQQDCNANGTGDVCELAAGTQFDCDGDGLLDSCEGGSVVSLASPLLAPFGNGFPASHTFTGLPRAYGAFVRLHIDATSDLNLSSEFIAVSFDGGPQEFFFVAGGTDCPATPDRETKTFTIPAFNALASDGSLSVALVASGTVSATQCASSGITLRLEYLGIQPGNDCNGNGQLDSCELGNGLAFDCNGNGRIDSCDVAAGLGTDCNANGRLDSCDLAAGTSTDLNGNGVLDECVGEWIVGGSGFRTIQAAIDAAPTGTTIRVGPGTYTGTLVIDSKQLVLSSIAGFGNTILSGAGAASSILNITGAGAAYSLVEGFTFRDGSVGFEYFGNRVGGGISAIAVTGLTIRSCQFVGNSAGYGGGVYIIGGSGLISDCVFSANSAVNDGGGFQIGGGASWQVARCLVANNSAPTGAGLHTWSSAVALTDTRFLDNTASGTGGAISWYSIDSPQLALAGCTIEGNSASNGGGVGLLAGSGTIDLLNTRFCRNTPQNLNAPFDNLGGNIFSQDCDGDGVCDDEEIAIASSASFVWNSGAGGNGKRYLRIATPNTWERASARAQALGGSLATITSAAEQAAVHAALGGSLAWLGASQPNGSAEPNGGWSWVTGEPWGYTNWASTEPSEQPAFPGEDRLMWFENGTWNDSGCPGACFYEIGAILELSESDYKRSRDCNANGIPDGCDIDAGTATDCNGNDIPDSCDIVSGTLADCNGNGAADICELGGTVAWGDGANGQTTVPAGVANARAIAAGCNHGLALDGNGVVTGWGSNSFGQTTIPSSVVNARLIAAGCDHSLAVLADGSIRAWGYNAYGQCTVPASASGSVVQLVAGANHSGVRKSDGTLVLWGRNIDGECNVPAALGPATSLALGGAHSIALRANGTILCWGLNNFGQCNVPASVGTLQSIAAGCYHSVGLRANGTVVAWGSTLFGQTSVPAGLANVVAIAAGSGQHTLALRSDGTVAAWGWNAFGQATVPAGARAIGEIAAGGTYSIARRTSAVDCNSNGAIDSCELAAGTAADCNGNGLPDTCDIFGGAPDCNNNRVPDSCELAANDCNGNGILDSCDLASGVAFDCNANGRIDTCDVTDGAGTDCNGNGKLDSCDLAAGTSTDLNGNGVLDECTGEFVVGGSGFRSVQAAIDAAPAGGTVLVGPGTFTGGLQLTTKPITLRSIGGAAVTTLSGTGLDRSIIVLRTPATAGSEIAGFRFVNGNAGTAEFGTRLGGAITLIETSADIRNCVFEGNSATYGGAIYAYRYGGIIDGCTFSGNSAGNDAGAVQFGFGGTVTFSNNTLTGNSAGQNGGAMQVVQAIDGPLTSGEITGCVFRNNTAGSYGGALSWLAGLGGDLAVTGCTVESNTDSTAAFTKLPGSVPARAFNLTGTRFCLNTPANISGPIVDSGGNTLSQDCNRNGICDADEIVGGTAADCDLNGIPDACQLSLAVAWGENTSSQATVPASVGAVRSISAGCNHALAIRRNGTLVVWGSNSFGQISPPPALGLVDQITAGCDHSMALAQNGALYAWGYNAFGQCNIPAAANGSIAQIAAGANHSGVRKNDGSLVLWGRNIDGECNVPAGLGQAGFLALGGAHTVAVRTNGTVACWGLNNFGQCNVPATVGTLRSATAGCYHTVGLRTNGTVVAWGSSIFGQTAVPAGLNNVVAVSAGSGQHTLALKSDGSVVAWGWNNFGQTTVPVSVTDAEQVAAGGTFSLARTTGADDCNDNGSIDRCEIAANAALDCNLNGQLDTCELADGGADCDNDGRLDSCEIASGEAADCNSNGTLDTCDLAAGSSSDLNGNLVPDECTGEFVVGGSGFATIQAAVTAAPNGATVVVGPGIYGPVDLGSRSVSIRAIGALGTVIIDGGGVSACIRALNSSGGTYSVERLVLRNGRADNGGGIALELSSPAVRDCIIEDCVATVDGGGVLANGSAGLIERCVIRRCSAAVGGGLAVIGFSSSGPFRAIDCSFEDNTASAEGGAIYNKTLFQLTASRVLANSSPSGAGASFDAVGSAQVGTTRFCLNDGENIVGAYSDLGGNTLSQDCNHNGICDIDEITGGSASDCNANGIPDSCELAGSVIAFGDNNRGQVDIPAELTRAVAVAAGCDHNLLLLADGSLRAWGNNSFGQATIPTLLPTRAIAAGCDHNLRVGTDGVLTAWGYNAFGQCNIPASAQGDIADIAAGVNHSGVRKLNGALVLWGRNVDGECNVPAGLGAAARLALGGAHSVALRPNGSAQCWGLNNFGQCNVPASAGTLQSIAAGCYHTVGLRTNGTVLAWGSSLFGQTSVPPGLGNVVAISAGAGQHTLALKADGSVVGWGWNAFGQSTVPGSAADAVLIAAGGAHSIVLTRPASDCNANNQLDSCEIAGGTQADCNGNSILDSCEIASGAAGDCDNDGALDSCEIAQGAPDCNSNGRPDSCDLASGPSTDLNGNGVPDECAGEFVVGGSGYAAIQSALNAAPDGATIRVGPGVWAPFSIQGRSLSLVSIGGAQATFVDGAGAQRASSLSNIAPRGVVIDGFTFRNGSAADGAGMKLVLASPTIVNCIFEDNVASGPGGGICCFSGSPVFETCIIRDNAATRGGGAWITGLAESGGGAQFNNCTISFNDASADGGGVGNEGRVTITDCTIESNLAGVAGGGLRTINVPGSISVVGASFFCLNAPDNISGPFSELIPNILGDDCNANGLCDIDEIAGGAEDKNQNNQLDTCELARGDLNLDGVIDAQDLAVLLNFWGAVNPPVGDLNGDGLISGSDLAVILNNWRTSGG